MATTSTPSRSSREAKNPSSKHIKQFTPDGRRQKSSVPIGISWTMKHRRHSSKQSVIINARSSSLQLINTGAMQQKEPLKHSRAISYQY